MSKVSKIKINLTSGNVVEKPLVTCFKGTNGNYIVFDNETNGSMGLPIICISKFNGTTAEKIFDQNEWASVKENLKTIIAGTALPYLNVPDSITAQDDFFTQLTLPVASFDLLKNVYAPVTPTVSAPAEVTPAPAEAPVVPSMPEVAAAPVVPEPMAFGSSEVISPAPVMATSPTTPVTPSTPVIDAPIISVTPEIAPTPVASAIDQPVAPVISAPTVEPQQAPVALETQATNNVSSPVNSADIIAIKENFMKSCENMFDALIKKFENK